MLASQYAMHRSKPAPQSTKPCATAGITPPVSPPAAVASAKAKTAVADIGTRLMGISL
jgi:hypothetical protein